MKDNSNRVVTLLLLGWLCFAVGLSGWFHNATALSVAATVWTLTVLVLLGCFYLVQGFGELVLQPSFEKFMEHVRLGTLDFALLKPVSAQFLVTLRNFQVVQLAQMGLGAIVVAVGLSRIPSIGLA